MSKNNPGLVALCAASLAGVFAMVVLVPKAEAAVPYDCTALNAKRVNTSSPWTLGCNGHCTTPDQCNTKTGLNCAGEMGMSACSCSGCPGNCCTVILDSGSNPKEFGSCTAQGCTGGGALQNLSVTGYRGSH
jgi:hypothetical protein